MQSNPCQHPIVILRDVAPDDLQSLLAFMYNGEVRIEEDRLKNFMRTAEMLQVQGLADHGRTSLAGEEDKRQHDRSGRSSASPAAAPAEQRSAGRRALQDEEERVSCKA